jgi:WD40 repeat protein
MRDDRVARLERLEVHRANWMRWRAGRLVLVWNRTWSIVLLGLAVIVPCPIFSRPVPSLKLSGRYPGSSCSPIVSLAFSADGQTMATTDESGVATLWQASSGWDRVGALEFGGRATFVAFSGDGQHLVIGGEKPAVALWDLQRAKWEPAQPISNRSTSCLQLSPNGRDLALASYDSTDILVWDIGAGRQRLILKGHSATVMHTAFGPDGRSLVSAAATVHDSSIIVWDLESGRPRRRIARPISPLQALAYSPDGKLIACASPHETTVRIWDAQTGDQVKLIAGHSFSTRSVAFSPDGRLLATVAGDGTGGIWSVANGQEIRRLDGEADVLRNVAFSPDGRTLAATGNDGDVRFWDVGKLRECEIVDTSSD